MKIIITFALAVSPIMATAQDCELLGKFAHFAMEARQRWATPVELVNGVSAEIPMIREIALASFDQPRYSTAKYQDLAAKDFQTKWEAACLRGELDLTRKEKK